MKKNMENDRGTQNKSSKRCACTTCTCTRRQEEKEELAKTIRNELKLNQPKKVIEEIIILWYVKSFDKMPPQWLVDWKSASDSILIGAMNERQKEKTEKKLCRCSKSK